uniref:Zinc finger protein CONSTANS-LIKE 1 n=1 Tax=Lagerstroemia indica TaxID=141186 RepID=A0A068L784_9MYRT|nr:zinc finger protein CONSTANS-LIKE 1 [Lagerstroemia indica]
MLKRESGSSSGDSTWARVCDTCRSAACTVYCRADSAYLCSGCDAQIHAANQVASRHERVWVCQGCERSPAAFFCKADAASLCAECDSDIHSANPLAHRHQRIPILPIPSGAHYDPNRSLYDPAGKGNGVFLGQDAGETVEEDDDEDEDEATSWLLLNPAKHSNSSSSNINSTTNQNNGFVFGGEADEYLDLIEYNSGTENHCSSDPYNQQQYTVPRKSYAGDSVVPVQFAESKDSLQQNQHQQHNFHLGLDYYEPSKATISYNGSLCHRVSVSSMDVGIVPESALSDISISHSRPPKGTIDLFSGPPAQMPTQLSPMDREARVLRYREKKKTRKFEKTIRYASRKAYAEMRPRIKGRFAKRTDVEIEVDQMFSPTIMTENGYGIVPSF